MGKKYTADTFEGAVTGTASGNVAKAGDTMTGKLNINYQNAEIEIQNTNFSGGRSKLNFGTVMSTDQASVQLNNSSGNLEFRRGTQSSTPKMTMQSSSVYFSDAIRIGADAAANELDDYEEGSFTPAFTNSGGIGISYYTQFGQYVKTGRQVTCWGLISVNTVGYSNSSGTVGIDGLPFNASFLSNQLGLIGNFDDDWNQDPSDFKIRKAGSNNDLIIFKEGGSGNNPVNMTGNYLASSTICNFSITYYTTS